MLKYAGLSLLGGVVAFVACGGTSDDQPSAVDNGGGSGGSDGSASAGSAGTSNLTGEGAGGSAAMGPTKVYPGLAAAGDHTCALDREGNVACWGRNDHGQLGDGTKVDRPSPARVPGVSALRIASSPSRTCAIVAQGRVVCWGLSYACVAQSTGQECASLNADNVTTVDQTEPAEVASFTGATDVSLDDNHTCAILGDTSVTCWGLNQDGQLGTGTYEVGARPTHLMDEGVLALSSADAGNLTIIGDGTVWAWGDPSSGRLGTSVPEIGTNLVKPTPIAGVSHAVAVGLGPYFGCAADSSSVRCWGLAPGSHVAITQAQSVAGLGNGAQRLALGDEHACALVQGGDVLCWGDDTFDQLAVPHETSGNDGTAGRAGEDGAAGNGRGGTNGAAGRMAGAGGLSGAAGAAGGGGIASGGGTAGAPSGDVHPDAARVAGLQGITSLATGSHHSCAADEQGAVWCWGQNTHGQLGLAAGPPVSTPTKVPAVLAR